MDKLIDFIKKIQTEKRIQVLNEEATKQSIILPILQFLGWQVFDADEVYPEFSIESTRVDYALRSGTISKVFIEVKKINVELDKHQEQLLTYSFRQGVNLSILTNGVLWWFYLPLQEGSWEQRKFYSIDMYSQDSVKIAEVFNLFLAKDKVLSGEALKNAKRLFSDRQKDEIIKINIPKAWRKLHIESDELLIELVAEKTENICGYRPENGLISEFLYSVVRDESKNDPEVRIKKGSKQRTPSVTLNGGKKSNNEFFSLNDNFTYKKITGFIFQNQNIEVNSWSQFLTKFIDKIRSIHNMDFDKIKKVSGKKRPYFTKNINELRKPKKILNSEYFLETNLSANNIVVVVKDVLKTFNYSEDDLKVKLDNTI